MQKVTCNFIIQFGNLHLSQRCINMMLSQCKKYKDKQNQEYDCIIKLICSCGIAMPRLFINKQVIIQGQNILSSSLVLNYILFERSSPFDLIHSEKDDYLLILFTDLFYFLIKSTQKNQSQIQDMLIMQIIYQMSTPNPQILEQFDSLIADYGIYPKDSIFRDVQKEFIIAFSKNFQIELPHDLQFNSNASSIDELKNNFKTKMQIIPSQINKILNEIKNNPYQKLYILKKKMLSINVLELERLIEKTRESEKLIQNKQIVLFIGNTSSGKSTAILKFLGYKLKKGKFNSLDTLIPTQKLKEQHKTFHTSPESKSCTRYINAVPFPEQMYSQIVDNNKKSLVICDSPGFGDTAGFQVDIANGVGMINALKKAKSVRIILILPYNTITADRFVGVIHISKIICNMIGDLNDVLDSIGILFNMVPKQSIQNLQQIIKNLIKNLNINQKGNQNVQKFLKHILKKAGQKENYFYPLQNCEKAIFKKIYGMQKMNKNQVKYQYEFSSKTKGQILSFCNEQEKRVKDCFQNDKFQQSCFHLTMLSKLKNILTTDNKIQQHYKEAAKKIQMYSDKLFTHYQQLITSVMNFQQIGPTEVKLKSAYKKIQQVSKLFCGFDNIQIVSKETIKKVINERANILYNQSLNIQKMSINTINGINIFSEVFGGDLKKKVGISLQKKYETHFKSLKSLIAAKKYEECKKNIKIIKDLSLYIIRTLGNTLQISTNNIKQLKSSIKKAVDEEFSYFQKILSQQSLKINDKIVSQIKTSIKNIRSAISLEFTQNYRQMETKLSKYLETFLQKCKKFIKGLEDLKPLLDENGVQFKKQELLQRKKQIKSLMQIEEIKQNLNNQYQYTLNYIKRTNQVNIQKINSFIKTLHQKSESTFKKIDSVKNSINIVTQYCVIVDQKYNTDELIQPIKQEFINYLQVQQRAIRQIDVSGKNIQVIQQYNKKIKAYKKFAFFKDIEGMIDDIKKLFINKLKSPFSNFIQYELSSIKGKSYKYITYCLESLQQLSVYSFKMISMLPYKQFEEISKDQEEIKNQLKKFGVEINKDVQKFIIYSIEDQRPNYLKDLIKTLISISNYFEAKRYFKEYAALDVQSQIKRLRSKLSQIKQELEEDFKKSQNKIQQIQKISDLCKYYAQNQIMFKVQQQNNIGFKQLHDKCQKSILVVLKSDEDKISEMLKNNPTDIDFQYLRSQYERFKKLNNTQAKQKIELIQKGLKKISSETLKQFHEIDVNGENQQKKRDMLNVIPQLVKLQENLMNFYKNTQINKQIIKRARKQLVQYYIGKYEQLRKSLDSYQVTKYKQKLAKFINLQTKVYNVIFIQGIIKNQKSQQFQQIQTIISQIQQLKKKIDKNQYIQPSYKKALKNLFKFKDLIMILHKGLQAQLNKKYFQYSGQLLVDQKFKKVYEGADQQGKSKLKKNIGLFMKKQYQQYAKQLMSSQQNAQKKKKQIQAFFNMLPSQLQVQSFQSLTQIQQQCIDKMEKNAQNDIDKFNPDQTKFLISAKRKKKEQNEIYKKYQDKFRQIFVNSHNNNKTIDQKIKFAQKYFINFWEKQHKELQAVQQINKIFKDQFVNWHKIISQKQSKKLFEPLIPFFLNPLKKQNRQNNYQQITKNLYKIYNYINKIQQGYFPEIKQIKQQYSEQFQKSMRLCIIHYHDYIKRKIEFNIRQQSFTQQKKDQIKNYYKGLRQIGLIFQLIKKQMSNVEDNNLIPNTFKDQLLQAHDYKELEKQVKAQISSIKNYLKKFEFFDDNKRNMSPKEVQSDLNKLNKIFKGFQENQQLLLELIEEKLPSDIGFNFQFIKADILKRFDNYKLKAQDQIKTFFKKIDTEPISKISLLKTQLQIMKKRQLQYVFIKQQKVKEISNEISQSINNQFKQSLKSMQQQFNQLKDKYSKMKACLKQMKIDEETKVEQCKNQKSKDEKELKMAESNEENKDEALKKQKIQQNSIKNELEKQIEKIRKQYQLKRANIKIQPSQSKKFCEQLIIFQKGLIDIIGFSSNYQTQFDKIIKDIKGVVCSQLVKSVQFNLENTQSDPRSIGKHILVSYQNCFHFSLNKIKKLIKGQDIEYVVKNLEQIAINGRQKLQQKFKDQVKTKYNFFSLQYKTLQTNYTELISTQCQQSQRQEFISQMVDSLKKLGKDIRANHFQVPSNTKIKLLAGVFALWVILKSQLNELTEEVQFTIQPHPTQITTLFLLLGIVNQQQILQNRLAQVGTGEGKSIILAGLCSYLALTGYNIKCACYSAYLSQRDSSNFEDFFTRLGVKDKIKYGTFNELCEQILNSGGSNLKQQIQKCILDKTNNNLGPKFSLNQKQQVKKNSTILVIDQVDVFFDESFFGKSYCPAISLKDSSVSQLLKFIWKQVKEKKDQTQCSRILQSKAFQKLIEQYPKLQRLLENQVNNMIAGALDYKKPDYLIVDKKICYKDGDTISDKLNYGYKTVFANLFQHERSQISNISLQNALQISLMFAEFSYAYLPQYFSNILGVTGTLQVLPKFKKQLLFNRYKIKNSYAIPSAFGMNKKRKQNYAIVSSQSYHQAIITNINKVKDNRPIILFFQEPKQLHDFALSQIYRPFLKRTYNLTQQHQASTRDSRIITAVNPNNITLMSRAFGRGTDFVLLDEKIDQHGGLHVIQAFLSLEQSEEAQIKGRTARQNSKGSYDCIIQQTSVQKLGIKIQEIKGKQSDQIHHILLKAREQRVEKNSEITQKELQNADKKHRQIFEILSKSNQKDLIKHIQKLNSCPQISQLVVKTVLALDATGSMNKAIRKTCLIISTAFERSYEILKKEKASATIQVKIMVYRNYNVSYPKILQSSAFENTPFNLKKFLETVQVQGGWGNEAIEVLFQSLNKEEKIDQVILIGDAPANTPQEVIKKRFKYKQDYWIDNGFPLTNINQQLNKFKSKNCPIHSFYLNDGTGFKDYSRLTNGESKQFQINSSNAAQQLTKFIVENILAIVANQTGNKNLKTAYKKMYG